MSECPVPIEAGQIFILDMQKQLVKQIKLSVCHRTQEIPAGGSLCSPLCVWEREKRGAIHWAGILMQGQRREKEGKRGIEREGRREKLLSLGDLFSHTP